MEQQRTNKEISVTDLAQFMRAISHPTRVQIILAIAKCNNKVLGEIVIVNDVAPTTVIQHLRDLKKAGIVQGKIFGTNSNYSLNLTALEKFKILFKDFIAEVGA